MVWLILDPLVGRSDLDSEPYRSAHHLGEVLGPVALGASATFAAYLIGTFFNEIRGVAARLYLRARQSAGSSASAQEEALEAFKQEAKERRRKKDQERVEREAAHLEKGEEDDKSAAARFLQEITMGISQGLREALRLMAPLPTMPRAVNEAIEQMALAITRRLIAIRIEPYRPFVSENGVASIEHYLDISGLKRQEAGAPDVADVIAGFTVVRTRLLRKSSETVNEYDRLRAEAEFRSAIFFPLLTMIGILVVKSSWLWAFLLFPLSILLATARAKRREAGDILADTLGSVVQAPCIQASEEGETRTDSAVAAQRPCREPLPQQGD